MEKRGEMEERRRRKKAGVASFSINFHLQHVLRIAAATPQHTPLGAAIGATREGEG